jgi:hypothetical protein
MLKWRWRSSTCAKTVKGLYRIRLFCEVWWAEKLAGDGTYWVIQDEDCPFADEHEARCACTRDAGNECRQKLRRKRALESTQPGEGN